MLDVLKIIEEQYPQLHEHIIGKDFPKIESAKFNGGLFRLGIDKLGSYSEITAARLKAIANTPGLDYVYSELRLDVRQSILVINTSKI